MNFVLATFLLLLNLAAAEKLSLKLEPALDFHAVLVDDDFDDLLLFRVVEPVGSEATCEEVTNQFDPTEMYTVCGGSFPLDLSMYDGIEISYEAPEGQEIRITTSGEDSFRVRVEFEAETDCDTTAFVNLNGDSFIPEIVGSNVSALTSNYAAGDSFIQVGKCDGCGSCAIFTRIQFSAATSFSGSISKISWSMDYESSTFSGLGEQVFTYDTDGYNWIRTPFNGALVAAPEVIVSTAPSAAPSGAPTAAPSDAPTAAPSGDAPSDARSLHSTMSVLSGAVMTFILLFSIN
jgi:hypothetical protein